MWLSLSYFGVDAFREAIDRSLDFAAEAEALISREPELELMSPAQLGIVCFRRRFAGADKEWQSARLNAALVGRFEQSGLGLVSSTSLDGRYAIRLCILNHTTTEADVQRAIEWFARSPVPSLADESAAIALSIEDRAPSVVDGLTGGGAFTVEELAAIPLFAELPPEEVARAARWSREQCVGAGETVVERWDAARDFYVIVDGDAEVFIDDEYVRQLEPRRLLRRGGGARLGIGLRICADRDRCRDLSSAPARPGPCTPRSPGCSVREVRREAPRSRARAAAPDLKRRGYSGSLVSNSQALVTPPARAARTGSTRTSSPA